MISKNEISNKVNKLQNGQTTSFSSSELGYSFPTSIVIHKNERGGRYTMSQCGDWQGDDNTKNEVIDFVAKEAR